MTWEELLDDVDRRLAAVEEGLVTGRLAVPSFTVPDDIGPLPAPLRRRVDVALRRSRMLEVELEACRQRTAEALRRGRRTARPPAVYVDRSV